ncbi:hypothetical protein JRI60_27945 [Archangium violaceum]|uniref:hypothetical protein n=1 Tax=Archangium violaceum TaxID=83451 RepID=UPI0019506B4E|nr:hypothetical protein [Archangium violaceum]QRN93037.1 hypothetical protein JRI60_27945 [Archangium violaceum]
MLNSNVVFKIREMAKQGESVCDMVVEICDSLGVGKDARVPVIAHLREAFGLGLAELMPIGAWSFFPGGTWSREEVEAQIMPLIIGSRDKWDRSK